ncbi:MAG TPA: zeta toxin family protein [Abditibacteriaceae bacterium]|jgi:predicted ABC-type ATPase
MPNLYLIGEPNGAGKTTIASQMLPNYVGCREFVNADNIAAGLSPFQPETVALQAGRLMLERMQALAKTLTDFAFESTLASRTFASFLQSCKAQGYTIHLLYIWLQNEELAVARVAARVRAGGHAIPEATIRRRYHAGRDNFLKLYLPLADQWRAYDNTYQEPRLIASNETIFLPELWSQLSHAK